MTFKSTMSTIGHGLLDGISALYDDNIHTQIDEIDSQLETLTKQMTDLQSKKTELKGKLSK